MGKFGMNPSKDDLNAKVERIEEIQDKLSQIDDKKIEQNIDLSTDLKKVKNETYGLSMALIEDLFSAIRKKNDGIDLQIKDEQKSYRARKKELIKIEDLDERKRQREEIEDEEKSFIEDMKSNYINKEDVINDLISDIKSVFPPTDKVTNEEIDQFLDEYFNKPFDSKDKKTDFIYKTECLSTIATCINLKIDSIDTGSSYRNINEQINKNYEYSKTLLEGEKEKEVAIDLDQELKKVREEVKQIEKAKENISNKEVKSEVLEDSKKLNEDKKKPFNERLKEKFGFDINKLENEIEENIQEPVQEEIEIPKEKNQDLINKLKGDLETKPVEKKNNVRFVPQTVVDYSNPVFDEDTIIKTLITPQMEMDFTNRYFELQNECKRIGEGAPYYNDYQKEMKRLMSIAHDYSLVEAVQAEDIKKIKSWENDPNMSFEKHCEEALAHMMRGEEVFGIQEFYKSEIYEPKNCLKFITELAEYSTNKELNLLQQDPEKEPIKEKDYLENVASKYEYQSMNYMNLSAKDKQTIIDLGSNLPQGTDIGDAFYGTLDKLLDGSITLSSQTQGFKRTSDDIGKAAEIILDCYQASGITNKYGNIYGGKDNDMNIRKDLNTYVDGVKSTSDMLNKFYKQLGLKDKNDNIAPDKKKEYDNLSLGYNGFNTYKRLKEVHDQRSAFFWLQHPKQNWAEYKALKEMKKVLIDKIGFTKNQLEGKGREGKTVEPYLSTSSMDGTSKLYAKMNDVEKMYKQERMEKSRQLDLQDLLERGNEEVGLENALSTLANKEIKVHSNELSSKIKEQEKQKDNVIVNEANKKQKEVTLEKQKLK